MQVRDGFAGVGAVVDDEAEATGEIEFFCNDAGGDDKVPERFGVGRVAFGGARDDAFRDD